MPDQNCFGLFAASPAGGPDALAWCEAAVAPAGARRVAGGPTQAQCVVVQANERFDACVEAALAYAKQAV